MPTEPPTTEVTPALGGGEAKHEALPGLMANLLEEIIVDDENPAKSDAEKAKESEAAAAKEKADADKLETDRKAAEAAKAKEKPIVARRQKQERPALPIRTEPEKKEIVPPPAGAAAAEEKLEPEEEQMIADAEEAERLAEGKHRGLAEKTKRFVKANIEFIRKHTDNEGNFDDESAEYQSFLRANKPVLTQADVREINEIRVTNRAREQILPEVEKMKDERFRDREEPAIEKVAMETHNRIAATVLPKDIFDAITQVAKDEFGGDRAKAFASLKPYYKPELDEIASVMAEVKADVAEMEKISRKNPETGRYLTAVDMNNPRHQRLTNLIQSECADFKDKEPQNQIKDGKWFVTRDEYHLLDPKDRRSFWTFSNKEVMDRALRRVPAYVAHRISEKFKRLEADGFIRKPREKKAAPVVPVKGAPAAARPSAIPANAAGGEAKTEGAKLAAILSSGGD